MQQEQENKTKPNKKAKIKERKPKAKKPKLKTKKPPKAKKQKIISLSKKECSVDKQEWTCPVCNGTWEGSQIDWIVCRICTVWVHEDCTIGEVCLLCE